jgi:hypothetical protein
MMLTRHTQVENLANLLAARRRQTAAHTCRQDAYQRLVAAILEVPVEGVNTSAVPAPATLRPAMPLQVAAAPRAA